MILEMPTGEQVLIDDDIATWAIRLDWCMCGAYAGRRVFDTIWYLHWYVIGRPPEGMVTDHINGNKLDNRKENLRHVTYSENGRNTVRHKQRTGVSLDRTHGTFKAYIDEPGQKRLNLGTFKTREDAEAAVRDARGKIT